MKISSQTQLVYGGGGKSPSLNSRTLIAKYHRKLLFAIPKAFWAILNDYKRFYLVSSLKMCCYTLLNNAHKAQKYELRYKNRHKKICESKRAFRQSLHYYRAFDKIKPQSKAWIESSEFKAKYLDTNHPYPPLLNPDSIDYDSIPAEFAWELNLPLPPNYDLIFLTNGVSGSEAVINFLRLCNVNLTLLSYELGISAKKNAYKRAFNLCMTEKKDNQNIAISFCVDDVCDNYGSAHLVASLSKKVPILYIARDPISRLKTWVNHIYGVYDFDNVMKRFNLTCNYKKLFPSFFYMYKDSLKPSCRDILRVLEDNGVMGALFNRRIFITDTAFNALQGKGQFYCVEFDGIKTDKAYKTFCKLANEFGFDKPKNKDLFEQNMNWTRGIMWIFNYKNKGVELYVHPDDISNAFNGGIENRNLASLNANTGYSILIIPIIYMNNEHNTLFIDISKDIFDDDIIIDNTKIAIIVRHSDFDQLCKNKELYEISKEYLKGYIQSLKIVAKEMESILVNESDIINYLKYDNKSRIAIKKILDNELVYIKTHHPDFIQKWKYYLEFEKMCAELDST